MNPIEDIPEFSGTASEIGAQYREYYQGEYESFFQKNSAIEVDSERADQFYEFVKETVPRWLFEAEACFGNDLKKFLHLNFLDPSSFPDDVLGNCTSVLIAGKSAVDGYPMLFKIRDHVPQRQLMFYRKFPESVQTLSGMIFGNLGLARSGAFSQ